MNKSKSDFNFVTNRKLTVEWSFNTNLSTHHIVKEHSDRIHQTCWLNNSGIKNTSSSKIAQNGKKSCEVRKNKLQSQNT